MSLWQKSEAEPSAPAPTPQVPVAQPSMATGSSKESSMNNLVNIGQSVEIKGELTGNEDLTIDGRVDGKISLKDHNLTIGAHGKINAELQAKRVVVNGQVVGNITATDKIEIAPTGSVEGDLTAPRVALADGSSFKGSIDMGSKVAAKTTGSSTTMNERIPVAAKS